MTRPPHSRRASGLKRLPGALRYSWQGLVAAWQHEPAFRQELALFIVLCPLALWLDTSPVKKLLLIGSMVIVLVVELLNSALEALADAFSPDYHALVGRAKDLASAAVFVSLMLSAAVWLVVLAT